MKKSLLLWILLSIVTVLSTEAVRAQTEDEPQSAADYRQLRDLQVFADTAYGQWVGSGGGLEIEKGGNGALPIDTAETHNGLPSYRVRVNGENGWWSFILAGRNWEAYSISPYYPDGALAFNIKGARGGEDFEIDLNDLVGGRTPENIASNKIQLSDIVTVTDEWQSVSIPLSAFLASSGDFNLDQFFTIGFSGGHGEEGEMIFWLNDIRFTSSEVEPSQAQIKLNQLGYTPKSQKLAHVSDFDEVLTAQVGTPFTVRDASSNQVVYEGELALVTDYDAVVSGERILVADFTDLQTPGQYFLSIDAYQAEDSPLFRVDTTIYGEMLIDTLRYFYLQRSGMPLQEGYAGKFAREAGHLQDAEAEFRSGKGSPRDVAGGWYDAGDYGKYVNAGATAVSDLLWAYELFPTQFPDGQLNIPESGNGLPDLLDEVRWELDWMLKMQDAQSGGFYHMVQPTEDTAVPDAHEPRFIEDVAGSRDNVRPTSTTASAAAALAHAATVFEAVDPDYAAVLLAASEAGWQYLLDNPNGVAPVPGPYSDDDDRDNRFWAAAALYRATGDPRYHDYLKTVYREIETLYASETDNAYSVGNMEMIAWLTYAYSDKRDPEMMDYFVTLFNSWSERMVARWQDSNWNIALLDNDFYWGSNHVVLTTPLVMVLGSQALGEMDETAVLMAQNALDYILGNNPLSFSYVSGYGENSVQHPFANQWSYDDVAEVPDGIFVSGPNAYSNPLLYSNFVAKRYVDSNVNWTINEHTVYWNASLVFLTALADYLSQPGAAPVVLPTPEPVPTAAAAVVPPSAETSSAPVSEEPVISEAEATVREDPAAEEAASSAAAEVVAAAAAVKRVENLLSALIVVGISLMIVIIVCTALVVRAMKRAIR